MNMDKNIIKALNGKEGYNKIEKHLGNIVLILKDILEDQVRHNENYKGPLP